MWPISQTCTSEVGQRYTPHDTVSHMAGILLIGLIIAALWAGSRALNSINEPR